MQVGGEGVVRKVDGSAPWSDIVSLFEPFRVVAVVGDAEDLGKSRSWKEPDIAAVLI